MHTLGDSTKAADPLLPTGLVFFPRILPESLQRSLVVETLTHARSPNLTSLEPHYHLPAEGLWTRLLAGNGEEAVRRKNGGLNGAISDGIASTAPCLECSSPQGGRESKQAVHIGERDVTVRDLIMKLRWSNVGWHYNVSESRLLFISDVAEGSARAVDHQALRVRARPRPAPAAHLPVLSRTRSPGAMAPSGRLKEGCGRRPVSCGDACGSDAGLAELEGRIRTGRWNR